jgi:hypothetical protein
MPSITDDEKISLSKERTKLVKQLKDLRYIKSDNFQLMADKMRRIREINIKIGKLHPKTLGNRPADAKLMSEYPPVVAAAASGSSTPDVTATISVVEERKTEVKLTEEFSQKQVREAKTVETNRVVVDNVTGATVEDQTIREEIKTESFEERMSKQFSKTMTEMKSIRKEMIGKLLQARVQPIDRLMSSQGQNFMFQQEILDFCIGGDDSFKLSYEAMSKKEFAIRYQEMLDEGMNRDIYGRINALHFLIQTVSPFMPLAELKELVNSLGSLSRLQWCEELRFVALASRTAWHMLKMGFYVRKEILDEECGKIGTLLSAYRVANLGNEDVNAKFCTISLVTDGHIKLTPKLHEDVKLFRVDADEKTVVETFKVRVPIELSMLFLTRDMAKRHSVKKQDPIGAFILSQESGLSRLSIPDCDYSSMLMSYGKNTDMSAHDQIKLRIAMVNQAMSEMQETLSKLHKNDYVTGMSMRMAITGDFELEKFDDMCDNEGQMLLNSPHLAFYGRYLRYLDNNGLPDLLRFNDEHRQNLPRLGHPAKDADIKTLVQVEAPFNQGRNAKSNKTNKILKEVKKRTKSRRDFVRKRENEILNPVAQFDEETMELKDPKEKKEQNIIIQTIPKRLIPANDDLERNVDLDAVDRHWYKNRKAELMAQGLLPCKAKKCVTFRHDKRDGYCDSHYYTTNQSAWKKLPNDKRHFKGGVAVFLEFAFDLVRGVVKKDYDFALRHHLEAFDPRWSTESK